MTFIVGAVAVCYSMNLFLTSLNYRDSPVFFRVLQWSGYIVASDVQNRSPAVTSISAAWIVPEIEPSENNTFLGVWVGIGGYGEDTLIQVGTEQEYINDKFVYYAWYELLPDYLIRIPNIHVRPGDRITASICLINESRESWLIEIADVTQDQSFEKTIIYNSSRMSAEWVVERPKVNGVISTLADFENVTFTECKATIGGNTGAITNFSYAQLLMYNQEVQLVTVSPPDSDGSSFTVSYLKSPSTTPLSSNLAFQKFRYMLPNNFCDSQQQVRANRKIIAREIFEVFSNRLMFIL